LSIAHKNAIGRQGKSRGDEGHITAFVDIEAVNGIVGSQDARTQLGDLGEGERQAQGKTEAVAVICSIWAPMSIAVPSTSISLQ
jgi:hypothetical protein